jgi:hypothetical protein
MSRLRIAAPRLAASRGHRLRRAAKAAGRKKAFKLPIRLNYPHYPAKGYPIAKGVIEGACRYLVKDRRAKAGGSGARLPLGLDTRHRMG